MSHHHTITNHTTALVDIHTSYVCISVCVRLSDSLSLISAFKLRLLPDLNTAVTAYKRIDTCTHIIIEAISIYVSTIKAHLIVNNTTLQYTIVLC